MPTAKRTATPLTTARLQKLRTQFARDRAARLAQNAVTQVTIDDVALRRGVVSNVDHTFSTMLDDWTTTNQKGSGRCWMFAGLNLFRAGAMQKMSIKNFEFSQNYPLFWDKLERANYFLHAIRETARKPVDDRTVAFLLQRPLDDGGQWNMFVSVVKKYGVCPQALMPETESSSNTRRLNQNLLTRLRAGACTLRKLIRQRKSARTVQNAHDHILTDVYRILSIHLGTPPERFTWQWMDKDRTFHRDPATTPQEFADKYITIPFDEYVCLVHDPRHSSPQGRTFTVQYLGNVVGGDPVIYLNVDIDTLKRIAMETLQGGEPVWFGCDTAKMMRRDKGIWDIDLFDYAGVYDVDLAMTKEERLLHQETAMNHAMLFTGVDVVRNKPRRWRVENSWGDQIGDRGFFVMNDNWFDEHMFEIAARRSMLPERLQKALDRKPIVLPPWDPMGALAR